MKRYLRQLATRGESIRRTIVKMKVQCDELRFDTHSLNTASPFLAARRLSHVRDLLGVCDAILLDLMDGVDKEK